jgi:carbonic anhydrase
MSNDLTLKKLFDNNRAWAQRKIQQDPQYFQRLSAQQAPKHLWIGCSDSRVPANQITGLTPGEVFVHRNVANLVVHTDLNCLSVIQYAVDVLKVEHIIVCGHYGCGGVQAVIERRDVGLVTNWLRHLEDVRDKFSAVLKPLANDSLRAQKLCELNILEQVRNVCESTIVQGAWKEGRSLAVHGWVYGIEDGLLKDLMPAPVTTLAGALALDQAGKTSPR